MKRKCLAIVIILLFVGTCIIPSNAQHIMRPLSASRGNWLYVGGSGPGNYTKIQNAIDNASAGDTVFVYSGSYDEQIFIEKSLIVSGQDRNTTYILGINEFYVPYVMIHAAPNVVFGGFTIQKQYDSEYNCGISITSSANIQIEKTCVKNFPVGIDVSFSDSVMISNNTIQKCKTGIGISIEAKNVTIKNNIIEKNYYGITVYWAENKTIIMRNTIQNNVRGIELIGVDYTIIQENNLLRNIRQVSLIKSLYSVWEQNYWNRPRLFPKIILGNYIIYGFKIIGFPYINIDWRPAQEPYDIPGLS